MVVKKVANPDKSASKAVRIDRLASYIRAPEGESETEKCVYDGSRGFLTTTASGHVAEMTALAQDASRTRDPIVHYVISWRDGEHPTEAQIEEVVDLLVDELGVLDHQAIFGLHADTDNIHLHVMLNRVHPDTGKVVKINQGFDLEALHRACARIEQAQGWAPEENARYRVGEDGKPQRMHRQCGKSKGKPTQAQVDNELRTGEKSAARIAIEVAAPIIESAASWDELHRELARHGMRYARKGKGAVVGVGDVFVKASTVSRKATIVRLESRLGPYMPAIDVEAKAQMRDASGRRDEQPVRTRAVDPKDAWPIIKAAQSWEALHRGLAQRGMRYAKTGSGATIFAGAHDAVAMKASAVARDASLRRLEVRLGPYVPARGSLPQGTIREPLHGYMPRWDEYVAARSEHEERAKSEWREFTRERDEEEERLKRKHAKERDELFRERSWEGLIEVLRVRRSLLAALHAKEKAGLKEEHRRRREALRAAYPIWPDYATWIEDPELALLWRRRHRLHCGIEPARNQPRATGAHGKGDIRDYHARQVDGWVLYTTPAHRARGEVAFVDRGKCITVHHWRSDAATLAALQLASAKWGAIVVTGDDDFKERCARLAAEHGFDLVNPELQDAIRIHRESVERQRTLDHEWSDAPTRRNEQSQRPQPAPTSRTPDSGGYTIW